MLSDLGTGFDRAEADGAMIVLRSGRPGIFSAGFELNIFAANDAEGNVVAKKQARTITQTAKYRTAEPSFSFRISPRLIRVARDPSDWSILRQRLISEGRIPGRSRINASTFSSWPTA